MMDLSFWPFILHCYTNSPTSFNPCYDGFVFLTTTNQVIYSSIQVSILVMMDLSFWQSLALANSFLAFSFQSLLWWICLFDYSSISSFSFSSSFNPCYDGFVFLTRRLNQPADFGGDGFQSLLWWICLFDKMSDAELFGGKFVSILVMMDLSFWRNEDQTLVGILFQFQSLLWWICLFDICGRARNDAKKEWFQSLLWWICLFDSN